MGHFCVLCGAPLVVKTIESREVEACPNDEFVLWHDPKVAAAMVVEARDGVVLGRRGIEPGYGLWCLPGGFVNDDESPAEAVIRECREEIGASVEVERLLDVYHGAKRSGSSIIVIAYRGRLKPGEVPSAGSEMLEVGVFRLDGLPEIAFPSHRQALARFALETSQPASRSSPRSATSQRSRTR